MVKSKKRIQVCFPMQLTLVQLVSMLTHFVFVSIPPSELGGMIGMVKQLQVPGNNFVAFLFDFGSFSYQEQY